MKFELKTEKESYSNSVSLVFKTVFTLALIIILCDVAFKLKIISRHYQVNHYCRLLAVQKSKPYFKKLSNLSNLKSKQGIWEFCMKVL